MPSKPLYRDPNYVTKRQNPWKFIPGTSPTSWKDICTLGRNLTEDSKLSFIPPCVDDSGDCYAKIDRFEIDANIQKWDNTLVGYVLGDKPFYIHLKLVLLDFGNQPVL